MQENNNNSFPSAEELRAELKREKYKWRYQKIIKSTVRALVVVAAVAVLIATLLMPVLQISGTSMEPTLNNKDIVVLVKSTDMDRGDLCGFSYSNKILIKRVIGLPGDVVDISHDGTVFVNGQALDEPYVTEIGRGECDIELPCLVPEEKYFLMGDHRNTSIDSRSTVIGCVSEEQIIGKLFVRVWPLTDFSFLN